MNTTLDTPPCITCKYCKFDGNYIPCSGKGGDEMNIITEIKCTNKLQSIHHRDYYHSGGIVVARKLFYDITKNEVWVDGMSNITECHFYDCGHYDYREEGGEFEKWFSDEYIAKMRGNHNPEDLINCNIVLKIRNLELEGITINYTGTDLNIIVNDYSFSNKCDPYFIEYEKSKVNTYLKHGIYVNSNMNKQVLKKIEQIIDLELKNTELGE